MSTASPDSGPEWRFFKFGLIVTGKGEEAFLPRLFRALEATGRCSFRVIRRIEQRSPIRSQQRLLRMLGSDKQIPDKDIADIGLPARNFLSSDNRYVLLIDDLEAGRTGEIQEVFERYRSGLDRVLTENEGRRASVHFLVNMLEAYYFADTQAVNAVLGTNLHNFEGDVETIRNPKRKLKGLCRGFDAIEHGRRIVERLDAPHVLSRPMVCCSLRTMFAWVYAAIEEPACEMRPWLVEGCYNETTRGQIDAVRGRAN